MWCPTFACPLCQGRLVESEQSMVCQRCAGRFEREGGFYALIAAERRERARPFLEQYRKVRQADGHVQTTETLFQRLPDVPAGHPNPDEWRIRRESFDTMIRCAGLETRRSLRVLDVGAGNGWLSNRLTQLGHAAVAMDLDDGPGDGLRAAAAEKPFVLVQADFDAMPFAPAQFDLVVMNASLHYSADPEQTLWAADRLLTTDGTLIVADSPMFETIEHGEMMVKEQLEFLRRTCAIAHPLRAGVGFLTFEGLRRVAERLGRCSLFAVSRGPLGWRARRAWSSQRLGRPAATFGVWIAR